jgi:hypothetical protein
MASKRPSYARADTDADDVKLQYLSSNGKTGHVQETSDLNSDLKRDTKKDIIEEIGPDATHRGSITHLPGYEEDDAKRRGSVVVTTAEDIVTRVLDVEDDVSLSPWTFRAIFLGMPDLWSQPENILAWSDY